MATSYSKEQEVAVEAVVRACQLCQQVFQHLVSEETTNKKDNSPVTIADYGAQAVVNDVLAQHFPSDPIVGEEDSKDLATNKENLTKVETLVNSVALNAPLTSSKILELIDRGNYGGGSTGRFWTLDPIDGTKGFLRGEQFAVCLALIEDGDIKVGVIGCPNLPHDISKPNGPRGSIFRAVQNGGAFETCIPVSEWRPIQVQNVQDVSQTQFVESVEAGHSSQGDAAQIAKSLGITHPSVQMDSQCKYGVVARGGAGIYLRLPVSQSYQEKIWDHASGHLLVKEAGGAVSDIYGKPLDFSVGRTLKNNKGVVASTAEIHKHVLSAVQKVLKLV